uniref:SAM domain-containing protein n=1 Tax=Rhabditophanes sp. KR3021 TaxID=114890 RepID=A0AC35U5S9_9BILA
MASRLVRFSSQKPIEHESFEVEEEDVQAEAISNIFKLQLPPILDENDYKFDLHTAASIDKESVEAILQSKSNLAKVNMSNVAQWTPLMYAARLGHDSICEVLKNKGALMDIRNNKGQTALMLAAACGHENTIKFILKQKEVKINLQDKYGCTALHYAVQNDMLTTVELLIAKNADVNISDLSGMTPTLDACLVGKEALLKLLLKKGGIVTKTNSKGENGVVLASDYPAILNVLRKHGINTNIERVDPPPVFISSPTPANIPSIVKATSKPDYSITEILKMLKLEKYQSIFEQNQIDMTTFFMLEDNDLKEMGITAFGPKTKLLNLIKGYIDTGSINLVLEESSREMSMGNNEINQINFQLNNDLQMTRQQLNELEMDFSRKCDIINNQKAELEKLSMLQNSVFSKVTNLKNELDREQNDMTEEVQLRMTRVKLQNILELIKSFKLHD